MFDLNPFSEFATILLLGSLAGFLGQILKQPLIVMLIAAGIIVGPSAIGILSSTHNIDVLAQIGIAVLLFVVGLKLDLTEIKHLGRVSLMTGFGQVVFTSIIGFFIALGLGYKPLESLYIAVALTFSSTIIIVKLLSDKKEIDSLHGRIAIGLLIVQDLIVIIMMIGLSTLGFKESSENGNQDLVWLVIKGIALLIGTPLFGRFALKPLIPKIMKNKELLIIFAIAWATTIAAIGEQIGIGKEVGAFLAGMSLANASYREVIEAKLVTLRDFLLFFFFIHLGATLNINILGEGTFDALVLALFVLIGNPLIVIIIMGTLGYTKRTGLFTGLTVAQISEFSLIFMAMGASLGHVDERIVGVVTLVGLITIGLSTYMILYSGKLYNWLSPFIQIFERKTTLQEKDAQELDAVRELDVILFGIGRFGEHIYDELKKQGHKILAVDFDPEVVEGIRRSGGVAMYGDMEDRDLINLLPLRQAKSVISTIPHLGPNKVLISSLREASYTGKIIVSAQYESHEKTLLKHGADMVALPFRDAIQNFCSKLNELI